jgi:hypothetical protein
MPCFNYLYSHGCSVSHDHQHPSALLNPDPVHTILLMFLTVICFTLTCCVCKMFRIFGCSTLTNRFSVDSDHIFLCYGRKFSLLGCHLQTDILFLFCLDGPPVSSCSFVLLFLHDFTLKSRC